MIDLRSDTQTKPSQGMREAMAGAEVGDEQRREDPTVLALEERTAAFLGQPEAVYLPTATMANQIALSILGVRGTELIVEETAHVMVAELGGAALHSGLQTRGLPGYRGRIGSAQLRAAVRVSDGFHVPRASVVAVENTHNSAGGTVWPYEIWRRSRRPPGSSVSARISTARGSRTRRSPPESRPIGSAGSSTR